MAPPVQLAPSSIFYCFEVQMMGLPFLHNARKWKPCGDVYGTSLHLCYSEVQSVLVTISGLYVGPATSFSRPNAKIKMQSLPRVEESISPSHRPTAPTHRDPQGSATFTQVHTQSLERETPLSCTPAACSLRQKRLLWILTQMSWVVCTRPWKPSPPAIVPRPMPSVGGREGLVVPGDGSKLWRTQPKRQCTAQEPRLQAPGAHSVVPSYSILLYRSQI